MFKRFFALFALSSVLLCGCAKNTATKTDGDNISENSEISTDTSEQDLPSLKDKSVDEIVSEMTIEEKVGQMIMLSMRSWEGQEINCTVPEGYKNLIRENYIGNIILFAENFSKVEDTVYLTHSLQNILPLDIPMFIGVDQEGGNVVRLSDGCSLTGNMALGAIGSEDSAYTAGKITGEQLAALGVNLNLAPTLDVNNNPKNPVINIRSFSEDPKVVAKLGSSMINGMSSANISVCAKHFPGHGDTHTDSHYGLPSIDKTLDEIEKLELVPFQAAIDSGLDMVMTAHIQFPQIESTEINDLILPATLSKKLLTDLLKGKMGFEGVVITDSMQMEAIGAHFTMEEASVLAINAGVDILLMPVNVIKENEKENLKNVVSAIISAVKSGEISAERIDDAVKRIIKVKKDRNLWESSSKTYKEKLKTARSVVGNEEHKKIERELAAKSVTILENKTGNLFSDLAFGKKVLFCVPSESIKTNVEFAIKRLTNEKSINITYKIVVYGGRDGEKNVNTSGFNGVVILTDTSSSWRVSTPIDIYKSAISKNIKTAVISCRLPYDAVLFNDADCLMTCYCPKGDEPRSDTATFGVNIPGAIEVLFGISTGEGKLPVTLYDASSEGEISLDKVIYPFGYKAE